VDLEPPGTRMILDAPADPGAVGVPIGDGWGGLGADRPTCAPVRAELGRPSGAVGRSFAAHTDPGARPTEVSDADAGRERWLRRPATDEAAGEAAGSVGHVPGGHGDTTVHGLRWLSRDAGPMQIGEGTAGSRGLGIGR
jgi:hypothetical protein